MRSFGYSTFMNPSILAAIFCLAAIFPAPFSVYATSSGNADSSGISSAPSNPVIELQDLATIIIRIAPISQETKVRGSIAQATFCLPQNILGRLLYRLLQLTGSVVETADMNEVKIIVTKARVGVSLGWYILLHESLLTENIVRHECVHVLEASTPRVQPRTRISFLVS